MLNQPRAGSIDSVDRERRPMLARGSESTQGALSAGLADVSGAPAAVRRDSSISRILATKVECRPLRVRLTPTLCDNVPPSHGRDIYLLFSAPERWATRVSALPCLGAGRCATECTLRQRALRPCVDSESIPSARRPPWLRVSTDRRPRVGWAFGRLGSGRVIRVLPVSASLFIPTPLPDP